MLANSGWRTAMTIHSRSPAKTIDKMADLALHGYAQNLEQDKRMANCLRGSAGRKPQLQRVALRLFKHSDRLIEDRGTRH